jgi:fermentation-respiration switch protein FrsA (DUF1100 family)
MWWVQEGLLFHVAPGPLGDPAASGHPLFVLRTLPRNSGALAFWAAAPASGRPVILHFHGNAGTAADQAWLLESYAREGWGVVLAEFSGWSGNPGGPPSEATLRRDAVVYADWATNEWPGHALVAWGESLGTGVAVGLAAVRPLAAVVLDAPYTSIADVGALLYPWLPVHALIRNPFDTMALLPRVSAPIMVIHGGADTLIPEAMGRRVLAAAPNPGPGVFLPGAAHTALLSEAGSTGKDAVRDFLEGIARYR